MIKGAYPDETKTFEPKDRTFLQTHSQVGTDAL